MRSERSRFRAFDALVPFPLPPERAGGSILVFAGQVMPKALSNDPNEDSNRVPVDPGSASRGGDEVSDVSFAVGQPLRGGGVGVEDFEP